MNYNNPSDKLILKEIIETIENELTRIGLFYRIFGRIKSNRSIDLKYSIKENDYINNNKKITDAFGLRIVLYFNDDIELARNAAKLNFSEQKNDISIDNVEHNIFGPLRYNVVYHMSKSHAQLSYLLKKYKILDATFEIQYRTILSEGWHEVEHDFRYKCSGDWDPFPNYSRALNGVFATLENCDNSMLKIFSDLSNVNFKMKSWTSMVRNLLRIRIENDFISQSLISFLNEENGFAKLLYTIDRQIFLEKLLESKIELPLTFDNLIFLANRLCINNLQLLTLEPISYELFENMGQPVEEIQEIQ